MFLTINPIAFHLGNLSVKWYGVIMAVAIVLATWMSISEGKKRQIESDDFIDLLLWAVPLGYVGARIYYVIFEWGYYSQHPNQIIAIWNGGIAIYGGLIAGLIVLLVFCYKRMLPPFLMLDVISPGIMAAQILGRWGNFINQEAHGGPTTLHFLESLHLPEFIIQQMKINGVYYQPTFLYESLFNLIGLIIILSLRHKKHFFKQGEVFMSYLMWYSVVRFFVEGLRTDSLYIFGVIRVSQLLSLILFIGVLFLFIYRRVKVKPKWYLDGSGLKYPYTRD
ncbi:prolipoprotein diacylglyceryl transferase [Lactobacillus acetotolerans]|jgi:phosphatidylglycerol:prolipoprotein diacylglycerol transferase|uniref:Phosphatidylglycerol--prolipoprotein diacylglyceryl transferase n=1 Tax=Lactobacillus acetotolerans TaxID=1600 RepID=A0A0D6A3Z9_9LACO|nr:prolipoprotein diacylglyceryl transferase [Lactobacillus acetotolerans]KRN41590.1 prolipoprotein diacylglyceryl transferase [Lactobacillus acetotolerans DSM 20749 = JCM 3825]MBN7276166.1 prolipoprotein diacylglyceryl transferase [Lactobacillus acetotolerans]QFG51540.1 prolipoprotein diacylglyceryl transferase [Lactobacillus acetotolerans]QGV04348.1 prolipoprotein diacylglyceryl transferase [Lactobacillus acetotolerans]BAQ57543.1 prolipoprotein diacylglyceryl transferase [Lactobacillus aceto